MMAHVHDDVALLNGLRSATRAHFRQASITSLHQIAALTVDELRQFRGIGKLTAPTLHAQARAWIAQRPMWLAAVPEVCQRPLGFFDIETAPSTQHVWSIGWSDAAGTAGLLIVVPHQRGIRTLTLPDGRLVALVPDTDAAWGYFADAVSPNAQPIAHWTGFDAGVMRSTAPSAVTARLSHRLHDLHHTFTTTVQIPAQGTSLKTVSAYVGFQYAVYEDWSMAYRDYRRWLATDDAQHLMQACAYQADDVQAMLVVWAWLNGQQGRSVRKESAIIPVPGGALPVASAAR